MKRLAARFTAVLTLSVIIFAPRAWAQSPDFQQEGPREIAKCQTISEPGSYKLFRNLTATGDCLLVAANLVTIDLAGFVISGNGTGSGILNTFNPGPLEDGTAVRNGSITNFSSGVLLEEQHSIVEGLRVVGNDVGIITAGIVKDNIIWGNNFGMEAGGVVANNNSRGNQRTGILVDTATTMIGNSAANNGGIGIDAPFCSQGPSNITDNTAVNNAGGNLVLTGTGCNNTNNVAP